MSFLSNKQIFNLRLKYVGKDVLISDKASFYNPQNISIGNNSRIDDFVVMSAGNGGIEIGKQVHIAVYASLIGMGKIYIDDYANISSRVAIYSSSDDFSGEFMTNPTVDAQFTNVISGDVYIGKHVVIGTGSVILPNVVLEEGAAIGALSLVKNNCKSFHVYAGIPARIVKKRSKRILQLSEEFEKI